MGTNLKYGDVLITKVKKLDKTNKIDQSIIFDNT